VGHMTNVCTQEHAFYCFDVLRSRLAAANHVTPSFPDAEYPLFVTWNTISFRPGGSSRLRGCIGNFGAMPLAQGLAEYALISALEDHRFRPIQESELPTLECGVSFLTDFEDVPHYLDWTIGTHGIYISLPYPARSSLISQRRRSDKQLTATYLPDVIPEQNWTKVEAVDSAIRKAGWDGVIDESVRQSVKLRRYQSRTASATWAEYLEWRNRRSGTEED